MSESIVISDKDLFAIFATYGNYSKCRSEAEKLFQSEHIPDNYYKFFSESYKRFKRLKASNTKRGNKFIVSLASNENSYNTVDHEVNSKHRRKVFEELGDRMKKKRTDNLIAYIDKYIEEECPELSRNQLLGYLLYRNNIQTNKSIAEVGCSLLDNTFYNQDSFTKVEAISLMHSLTLSREQIRKIRFILISKGIHFPTTNELCEARKVLRPVVDTCLYDKGVVVDYKSLIQMTTDSVLNVVLQETEFTLSSSENYKMSFKDGGDGAGQQVTMKTKSMVGSTENIFQYGITPLQLSHHAKDGTTQILWKNHAPNSARSLRPIYLIRETETDEDLLDLVVKSTDAARDKLNEDGICCIVNDQAIDINIFIQDTMKDLKFKRKISGLGGASCILCESKTVDWTTLANVQQGFPIERNATDTFILYEQLVNENGDIPVKPDDFDTRKGLTKKPITNSSQKCITITHSYINGTTWFLKLLYRCNIDYRNWVEKSGPLGEPIRKAKKRVLDIIQTQTGLYLDSCNKAGGHGGTSTNGPQGRRFFSEELVPVLPMLCDRRYIDNVLLLHRQLSVILRIVSSTRQINVELFHQMCKDFSMNLINNFPWARLNHTLHGTVHHSTELIVLNDGQGLGMLSEEGLESNNKDIRNYLQFLCRKSSAKEQLTDVMCRLLERSDPVIYNTFSKNHFPKRCTECDSNEHTIRSHGRIFAKPSKEFDSYVESIILD